MNYTQFANYTAFDFTTDPLFIEWRWLQTDESCQFWDGFLAEYPDKKDEILLAIEIVASFKENNDDFLFSEIEKENAVKRLTEKVHRYKRRLKTAIYSISTFVILASLFFLPFKQTKQIEQVNYAPVIERNEKEVQLILSSGKKTLYNEDIQVKYDSRGNIVVESESGKILEKHENEDMHSKMNRLIVPKGKRSSLLLVDGSRIWVNSGTTVEFPSSFSQNDRRINIDGEIYIEVEKDPQRPFYVSTQDFDVVVLGTAFNVAAYSEDELQHITVAEGSVSVVTREAETRNVITSNQQLRILNGKDAEISNVDVYNFTSWREGILRFESEPLPNILTRLSRYYDIDLLYGADIQSVRCSGKLYLFDEWQVVLDNITNVSPVEYRVENNQVEFYHTK
jgi:hypothetical protein